MPHRSLVALAAISLLAVPVPAAHAAKPAPKPLHVLVTNDDGVRAPGIDALVRALRARPKVTVTVIAPATNQSGTGGKVTPGRLSAPPRRRRAGSRPSR